MAQAGSVEQFLKASDNAYRQGDIAEAVIQCRNAVSLDPGNAQGQFMLGALLGMSGDLPGGLSALRKAVEIKPNFREANLQLVALLRDAGRLEEAVEVSKRFAQLAPNMPVAHTALAFCLVEQGMYEEAIRAFQAALNLNPQDPQLRKNLARGKERLGHSLQEAGRFAESIRHLEDALYLDPGLSWPHLGIVLAKKVREEDRPLLSRIQAQLLGEDLSPDGRKILEYALGKALDDLADFEQAMAHFDRATEIVLRLPETLRFDHEANTRGIEFTLHTFTKEFVENHRSQGLDSRLPVFIVGVPRSGTTLLEQMISSHPEVGAGGELPYWHEHGETAFQSLDIDPVKARTIADDYLKLLRNMHPLKTRVTDKLPVNYTRIGLLAILFPSAKIIHCRRHPVDNCLSLYMNAHSITEMPFGNSKKDLVDGYLGYLRVMEHWRDILPPGLMLEVDYEKLVTDTEKELKRIVSFCGLDWDEACLQHEKNARDVNTPSRWQVRQPVYVSSVARWRHYEPWLGEFSSLLSPTTP